MSEFAKTGLNIKRLAENSYAAIDEGVYNIDQRLASHGTISLKKAIGSCTHAPLITEVKFSSPSQGKIRSKEEPYIIAKTMADHGASGISVLTQPSLFDGSPKYLASIRETLPTIPLLMKDIIVSRVQIDAGRNAGADCILLIKTIFDNDLAEDELDRLLEYATKRDLEVLVEVHTEQEFEDILKLRHDLIGINNRNLDNLQVDISNTEKLLKRYDKGKATIISESGISNPEDVQYLKRAGADAFLVGTSIMQTSNIGDKISRLYYAL